MIPIRFQGKPFSITVIQVYAPTTNAEKAKIEQFGSEMNRDHSVISEIATK